MLTRAQPPESGVGQGTRLQRLAGEDSSGPGRCGALRGPPCPGGRDPGDPEHRTSAGAGGRVAWPGQQRGSGRGAGEPGTHVQVQVVVQESEEGRAAAHSPLPLVGLLRHQPHVQVLQGRAGGVAERTWLRPRPGPRPPSPDHTLSGPAHLGAGPAPSTAVAPRSSLSRPCAQPLPILPQAGPGWRGLFLLLQLAPHSCSKPSEAPGS